MLNPRFYLEDPNKKTRRVKGGAIFIANHTHIMDYFTMQYAHAFRKQRTLVSEAIYQHPALGFLTKMMDDIMIHRENSDLSFMEESENTLKKGQVVTIYPEGHLMKNGKIDSFKPSVVYLALRTGAPIIPHYIEGNYFKLKRTRVIVGKPIYLRDYCKSANPSIQEVRDLCEMLRDKVKELKRKMDLYRKYHTRDFFYFKSWFFDLARITLWFLTPFVFPTKFHYVGNASKKDRKIKGKGLIVSKHFGFNDPPILDIHYISRRLRIIIAEELWNSATWLFKHLLCIEYRRVSDSADPRCFMEVINTLKAEGVVGIYPEGHLTLNKLGEFHDGAAYFAIMSRAPIHLYYQLKPYKAFHKNHVMIGETIHLEDLFSEEELKNKETIQKLTQILYQKFLELEDLGKQYLKPKKQPKKA